MPRDFTGGPEKLLGMPRDITGDCSYSSGIGQDDLYCLWIDLWGRYSEQQRMPSRITGDAQRNYWAPRDFTGDAQRNYWGTQRNYWGLSISSCMAKEDLQSWLIRLLMSISEHQSMTVNAQ